MSHSPQIHRIRHLRGTSSLTAFARRLGISRTYLSLIEAGKRPISASVAIRLHRLSGEPLEFWVADQSLFEQDLEGGVLEDPAGEGLAETHPPTGRAA